MTTVSRERLATCRRIIVKLGTGVVTHDGVELALGRVHGIVEDIAYLRRQGCEVVLVASGAVGIGVRQLRLPQRPTSLGLRQACAAVGQGHLMGLFTQAFAQLGLTTAQVLLTHQDLGDRDRALCLRTTLMRLLELRTIPILNENDSVSVRELVEHRQTEDDPQSPAFGDNDELSARVAVAVDAELLILLTNVEGLLTANPQDNPNATRISALHGVDDATLQQAGPASGGGTGGMRSKLLAANLVTEAGIVAVIGDGSRPSILRKVLAGEDLGTVVWPTAVRSAKRRHIAARAERQGALIVNEGAIAALVHRKASLLPIGVIGVEGQFRTGDVVEIRDRSGRVHGRGLVNYDARSCAKLAGHHSSEIDRILDEVGYDALVTRDNLVLGDV